MSCCFYCYHLLRVDFSGEEKEVRSTLRVTQLGEAGGVDPIEEGRS